MDLRKTLFVMALLGGPASTACDDQDNLSLALPDIATDPPAGSSLAFEPYILDLDFEVPPQRVVVRNEGIGGLRIQEVVVEGADGSQFRVTEAPTALSPGNEDEIFFRFEPEVHKDMIADLVIRSNDPSDPELRFPLDARARERCVLSMEPAVVDMNLGDVVTVKVRSISKSPCDVQFLGLTGGVFTMLEPPQVPFTIMPGDEREIDIVHDRQLLEVGTPVGELVARDAQEGRVTMQLRGEAAVGGCIEFRPRRRLVFSSTPIGSTTSENVQITNTCARPMRIRNVAIGLGRSDFAIGTDFGATGFDLPPFDTVDVPVEFTPFIAGTVNGALVVATTDVERLVETIELVGTGDPPIIDVFPASLDFGSVKYRPLSQGDTSECASRAQQINVFSKGRAGLTIDKVEIESESDDLFLITGLVVFDDNDRIIATPDPSSRFVLPPQSRLAVTLQFFPTRLDPALHTGTLRIEHDAQGGLSRVELRGTAEPDEPVVERFEQLRGPKVDIMWVIDDSCSMVDEQARLIANLTQFVSYADSQNADYQMAVTDTDGASRNSGDFERCFPHPAVIANDYPDREQAFRCTFDVGTGGSGIEAGLGAAKNGLVKAQAEEPNLNTGFLRDDAALAIVIMSDEEDQSVEDDKLLELFFDSVKGPGRASQTKIHAIAGPTTEPCDAEEGFFVAQPGFRYERFTRRTGGNFFNICLNDWSPVLEQLGLDTFEPFDTWYLSQAADPVTLRVFVDGAEVLQNPNDGWEYLFDANAVRFNGDAVPGPGSRIEVRYGGICSP